MQAIFKQLCGCSKKDKNNIKQDHIWQCTVFMYFILKKMLMLHMHTHPHTDTQTHTHKP